ncbi:GNAT family N-acetyltransferase [Anatilimnocola floriformis]|uniref:GNAT family N-acetyltransferase n=1 Tax=Anatilimnocola floriformis TaxID=2948575 RepID=UPI0020C3F9B8|nr:GNAT family N-acetyltransferase [Anatilimnocola floriformis]
MNAIAKFIGAFAPRMEILDYRDGGSDEPTLFSCLFDGTAVVLLADVPQSKHDSIEIRMFGIAPKMQRQGLGRRLLNEITAWADTERVVLNCEAKLIDLAAFDFTLAAYNKLLLEDGMIGKPFGNTLNDFDWSNVLIENHGFERGRGLELKRVPRKSNE